MVEVWRAGTVTDIMEVVQSTTVFANVSRGFLASHEDRTKAFGPAKGAGADKADEGARGKKGKKKKGKNAKYGGDESEEEVECVGLGEERVVATHS